MNFNTYDYRKDQSYTTDRPATPATGGRLSPRQKPCFPYVLSRRSPEINRPYFGANRLTDRNDPYISKFPGEAFRYRRNPGIEMLNRCNLRRIFRIIAPS